MISLRARLKMPGLIVAPGCYDALSALLIERAGFEAAYVSGASIAYTRLGRPDIGLVSFSELADIVAAIRERVSIPLIVDMDTGFGNALNVQRSVKLLAQAGASVIVLERIPRNGACRSVALSRRGLTPSCSASDVRKGASRSGSGSGRTRGIRRLWQPTGAPGARSPHARSGEPRPAARASLDSRVPVA